MPSSFVGFICGWFSTLSNPSCSVFATQGVYSSGSVKRSLSLDCPVTHRVFSVVSSFMLIRDVVGGLYGRENISVGSNNSWSIPKFILHWFSSSVCPSSYFQRTSSTEKYLALSSCPSGSVVNELTVFSPCLSWFL